MSDNTPKDWRELCRRAAQELDPEKLLDLIVQINKALDERAKKQRDNIDPTSDLDRETEAHPKRVPISSFGILHFARAVCFRKHHPAQSLLPA